MALLVTTRQEMIERKIDQLDFILISADAYVDHPAFAAALLGRFLEAHGFTVGVIAQPNWRQTDDFMRLGAPRLAFGVSGGNVDSMVSHYTADKKRRREDDFSPGGKTGWRPDRPTIVYTNRLREAFPGVPIIIGGIEASLRRVAHYDYWDNKVRRSILFDSRADLLVYGMGEYPLLEILTRLQAGENIAAITDVRNTAWLTRQHPGEDTKLLPTVEEVSSDGKAFNNAMVTLLQENNPYQGHPLAQGHTNQWVVVNPPALPLNSKQLDSIYEQPFTRAAHPSYQAAGGVPALATVQFSVVSHRGCFGGCHFCSLALHQGRFIQSRSQASLIKEVQSLVRHPGFKGTIQDVGGPSANMYRLQGKDTKRCQGCQRQSCLHPKPCANLNTDHRHAAALLQAIRQISGVKHVFVASGIRYDLINAAPDNAYLKDLVSHHVSGQLKIAPEHVSPRVTARMGKPGQPEYDKFMRAFAGLSKQVGKKQYLVPYFIAGHPGCDLKDMLQLAEFIRDELQYYPEQVQNFTPTPMTISTAMYYTGLDPFSGQPVHVPREDKERRLQRALLQYKSPQNRALVREALESLGRKDLIGSDPHCLIYEPKLGAGGKEKKRVRRSKPKRS
ncbi:MAG: YgiQ family radical SAM protein [Methylocystaceae bacterium]